jgi:hypothetical protein
MCLREAHSQFVNQLLDLHAEEEQNHTTASTRTGILREQYKTALARGL